MQLRHHGAGELGNDALLALLMANGNRFQDGAKTAKEIAARYPNLRSLAGASVLELTRFAGVKEVQAARIVCALELARRMEREKRRTAPQMRSGADFYRHYHMRLRDLRQEVFLVVLLDQKNRVLTEVEVSRGSLTATLIHPREVFAPAIRNAAAAVALLHNHPSGDPAPSGDDRRMTERLANAAEILGIRLLDHVVVGEGRFISFVDEGWI
jgi:DNA repair protein RadC